MKSFKYLIVGFLLSVTVGVVLGAKIEDDTIKLCVPNTADSCFIVFDTNDGAGNMQLEAQSGSLRINNGPLTASQITGSDIDLGTASDTSRLTVGSGSSAVLSGLTRKAATVHYDTDQQGLVVDNGSDLVPVGSGAGGGAGAGINIVDNSTFEINANSWTPSGSGTVAQETANPGNGSGSLRWTPSAGAETLVPDAVTIPDVLNGKNCLSRASYRYPTGSDGDVTVKIVNGGDDLTESVSLNTTPATGEWRTIDLAYICPTGSQPRFEFTTSATNNFFLDDVWTGTDFRLGETASARITEWKQESFSSLVNVEGGMTFTVDRVWWRRVGENMEVDFAFDTNTGFPGTSATMSFTIPDGKSVNTNIRTGSISDGDKIYGCGHWQDGGNKSSVCAQGLDSTSMRFVVTNDTAAPNILAWDEISNGDQLAMTIVIPIAEWANEGTTKTVTLDTQGFRIRGEIGGNLVGLSLVDTGGYSVINNSALTMQLAPGSKDAKITCSGNPAVGLDCGGNNEQVGVSFIAPTAGDYEICMDFSTEHRIDPGELLANTFKIVVKSNSDDTVLQDNSIGSLQGSTTQGSVVGYIQPFMQHKVCDTYTLSPGENSFSLRYFTNVTGTPPLNNLFITRSATFGNPVLGFEIKNVTEQKPQAIAINDVESGANNVACANGNICSGTVDITFSNETLITVTDVTAQFFRVGDLVTLSFRTAGTVTAHADNDAFLTSIDVPFMVGNFTSAFEAGGSCGVDQAGASSVATQALSITGAQRVQLGGRYDGTSTSNAALSCTVTYTLN